MERHITYDEQLPPSCSFWGGDVAERVVREAIAALFTESPSHFKQDIYGNENNTGAVLNVY